MCGIGGIRTWGGFLVLPEQLQSMAAALRHRGPDESATWMHEGLGLAHTRLSIIDLASSHQPMASEDGRWVLVFNGEIYNYRELRASMSDYPFQTAGDTEVILAGLSLRGIEFVTELRGQFAFAAHDQHTATTHLVRDRLGILPLYFKHDHRTMMFGSEIKAILAAQPDSASVDGASLDSFLTRRAVPAPHTLFRGIRKLEPATRVEFNAEGNSTVVRYWSPRTVDAARSWTEAQAVDAVDAAIRDAVEASMVADVPVGSYLSGGVDSSLIVAVAQQIRGNSPLQTFAAGFGDPRHDELPWARRVSDLVGTRHHEVNVRPKDFESLWARLTWHRDAPISEPADVAVFRLAELARQHVRVVLSGEGGDELFAGYPKYRMARQVALLDVVPGPVRSRAAALLDPLLGTRAARARIALRAIGASGEEARFDQWFSPFTPTERARLLGSLPQRDSGLGDPTDGGDVIERMLRHGLRSWLPDNLLERGDRMSMAASLELRPPLLDHKLVDLAMQLPSSFKVHRGITKWVLKEVARRYLPDEVVDRKKTGFRVPLDEWFRGDLRDSVHERLTDSGSFVAQTLDTTEVGRILERHESGRSNEESPIWTLMCLDVWHETFFRQSRVMS